jgi:hypothetical protein
MMSARFSVGDRVVVSRDFYWAKGATGTIAAPPQEVVSLSGPWDGLTRIERSALGEATVYWVEFDEPQLDADGDGPYRAGSIHEKALSLIVKAAN